MVWIGELLGGGGMPVELWSVVIGGPRGQGGLGVSHYTFNHLVMVCC